MNRIKCVEGILDDFIFRAGVTVIQPNGDQSQALVTAIDPLLHGVYRLGAADHRGGQNGAERKQPGHQPAGGTLAGVPMLPGRSIKSDHQRDSQSSNSQESSIQTAVIPAAGSRPKTMPTAFCPRRAKKAWIQSSRIRASRPKKRVKRALRVWVVTAKKMEGLENRSAGI